MPRSKTGKKRDKICPETLTLAVKEVISGTSVRKASQIFKLPKSTIFKYVKINNQENNMNNLSIKPLTNDVKKIFSEEEETKLYEYLKKAASLHFGLDIRTTRKLSYDYAKAIKKTIPNSWNKNEIAGREWLNGFRKRFPSLSLRKPEPTSLGRATSFNKSNVMKFFENLKNILSRYNIRPENIYNIDETALSTVHKPVKVLAPKSIRQLGKMTSGERGITVTMIGCINAIGNAIPPMLIFPRVFYKEHMLKGAPPGSVGDANSSGWSTEVLFRKYLDHFISHVKPSKEKPALIIMDNHETHISIDIIDKSRENGVVLLTLHPHTTHKLQPLDRTVFGPLKAHYNKACDKWMLQNPGKPITIYDVSELLGQSYFQVFTSNNIVKAFKVTGIYPFDQDIFSDLDFASSYVTDRSERQDNDLSQQQFQNLTNSNEDILTLESILPFPKAAPRKTQKQGRKIGKTRILTDTPEKLEILNRQISKQPIKKEKENKKKIENVKKNMKDFNQAESSSSKFNQTSKLQARQSNIKTNKNINIISDVTFVKCCVFKNFANKLKTLICSLYKERFHLKCISESHRDNIPDSDDESCFVCQKCFKLNDQSDDETYNSEELLYMVQNN